MSPLIVALGPLLAASVVHGTAVGTSVQPVVLSIESPYPLEETVARLAEALAAHDFRRIPERNVGHGLGDRPRENSRVLNFCNFRMLDEALAADPQVASAFRARKRVEKRRRTGDRIARDQVAAK